VVSAPIRYHPAPGISSAGTAKEEATIFEAQRIPGSQRSLQLAPRIRRRILAVCALLLGGYVFWTPLQTIFSIWMKSDEYNYGPLIPFIAAAMLIRDLRRSSAPEGSGWFGLGLLCLGLVLGVFGKIAAFVYLAEIGVFLFAVGLFAAFNGDARARSVWPGLIYLAFAIPLARLLQASLSAQLQLISSYMGAGIVRALGIPVLLDGNVIDLGAIQLEVAEACSGLRYLFPLASFGFLCAYLFRGRMWERAIILLSTIPITVLLNSLRIGITGILVDRFGIVAAQGFFHDFEGWLIFCACVAILFLEIKLLCLLDRGDPSLLRRLDLSWPAARPTSPAASGGSGRTAVAALVATAVAAAVLPALALPDAAAPSRAEFASFPRTFDQWSGTEAPIDSVALDSLNPTDYLSLNYFDGAHQSLVQVWIAYYATQEIGEAIHSPRICIPAGGWQISDIRPVKLDTGPGGASITANRAIIRKGEQQQLVYYWFQGRGRIESNEYQVKLHLMADAVLRQRTDGALVRVITPFDPAEPAAAGDQRLSGFLAQFRPRLQPYLPD